MGRIVNFTIFARNCHAFCSILLIKIIRYLNGIEKYSQGRGQKLKSCCIHFFHIANLSLAFVVEITEIRLNQKQIFANVFSTLQLQVT